MYLLDKAFLRLLESYGLGNEPVTFETVSLIYIYTYSICLVQTD